MRAFLGIDLSPEWRDALDACARAAHAGTHAWSEARWVPRENLHVTLKFLGDFSADHVDRLVQELGAALASVRPFDLVLGEPVTGVQPGRRTRMLWSTFDDPSQECARLASLIDEVAARLGVPPEERAFRPHVTLARTKTPRRFTPPGDIEKCLVELPISGDQLSMSVGEVTLFSSTLTRDGAVYNRVARIPLEAR